MRADERAVEAEVERDKNFRSNLYKGAKTAANVAATVGAAGLGAKILPWLSEYIPTDLAMKGLEKVSPKTADFLRRGQSLGLDVKEGMEYIKDEFSKSEEKNPKESRNVIQQYSPELHQFIDQEIKKGRNALEAGAIAQSDKRFKDVINKLTKDHKTPWSGILESVYGSTQQAPVQPQQTQGLDPQLAQIIQGIKSSMNNLGVG